MSDETDAPRRVMYFHEDDGVPRYAWVIRYEKKLWLVPQWDIGPTEGTLSPARIICLFGLPVGSPSRPRSNCDLILETPLSKRVLEGRGEAQNLQVMEKPPIVVKESDVL